MAVKKDKAPRETSRDETASFEKKESVASLLNNPLEISFPRGGGTTLAPIEVHEAIREGQEEFDRSTKKKRSNSEDAATDRVVKDKKKKRKLEKEQNFGVETEKAGPRIEHLNYKRLIPGTKVLAQVIAITPFELIVSLPNQLLGHIPITNISPKLNEQLEDEEGAEIELESLFSVGQFIPAVASENLVLLKTKPDTSREDTELIRSSRKIGLTVEPSKVNEGVVKKDIKAGLILNACVKSVEDHGYLLDFGVHRLTSMLPFSKKIELKEGQVVTAALTNLHDNKKTCDVTLDIASAELKEASSITSVIPGQLVKGTVTVVTAAGLKIKFFDFYEASVDEFHLDQREHAVGDVVTVRIIWDALFGTQKSFAASLNAHLVGLDTRRAEKLQSKYPVGKFVDAKVTQIDADWGVTTTIKKDLGFVHISRLSDDRIASIPTNAASPWKVGSTHQARVVGHAALDGAVILSLEPSALEYEFLRAEDVRVGQVFSAKVKRLSADGKSLFLSLPGPIDGVVWPLHYADTPLTHPERKFKPNATVKAKVYHVDATRNRIVLTLRRSLLDLPADTELPSSLADLAAGTVTVGVVNKVLDNSVVVDLFGSLSALVPRKEAGTERLADLYARTLRVRITSVDAETRRVLASIRKVDEPDTDADAARASVDAVPIGTLLDGTVAELHETNAVVACTHEGSALKGLISYAIVARVRRETVADVKGYLAVGDALPGLVVVSKNAERGFVVLGLSKTAAATAVPRIGAVITGRISGAAGGGVRLALDGTTKRGFAPRVELSDDFDDVGRFAFTSPASPFAKGTAVTCVVISEDAARDQLVVSLRASRRTADAEARDPPVDAVDALVVGERRRGFVVNIADTGLFVALGAGVTGRVQIKEMFDSFVQDWKSAFHVSQLVTVRVKSVDVAGQKVELSLKQGSERVRQEGIENVHVGDVLDGTVQRIETYGVFVHLNGTGVNGLCHKSNVTDDSILPWETCFSVRDAVRAKVLDVDLEARKVSLGLKASLLQADVASGARDSDDSDGGDDSEDTDDTDDSDSDGSEKIRLDSDSESDVDSDATAMDLATYMDKYGDENVDGDDDEDSGDDDEEDSGDDDEEDSEDDDEDTSSEDASSESPAHPPTTGLTVAGFDWTGANSDSESDSDFEAPKKEKKSTNSKASGAAEKPVRMFDDDTPEETVPTTVAEFEKRLLGAPNSSLLWMQYMAFYVEQERTEEARVIGRRALRTINYRKEDEKLNVWLALLNLENSFGSDEATEKLFLEAVQHNDAQTVYVRMCEIYERSGKVEQEEELFQKLVKKFSRAPAVWILFAQFYFRIEKFEEGRALLARSLKSLEKPDHVATISKFAQLEFKQGDPERGRTVFEGIIQSYPRRLDLWMVYIDMEIKQRNVFGVRRLFERLVSAKSWSSKKGKSIFKKWLAFEKEFGDESGVQACKTQAVEFVSSLSKRNAANDEDDDE